MERGGSQDNLAIRTVRPSKSKPLHITPRQRYETLVAYLCVKVSEKDWHGVMDAAADLRELIAANPGVEQ